MPSEASIGVKGKWVSVGTAIAVISLAIGGFGAYREHDRKITEHDTRLSGVERSFDKIDAKLDRLIEANKTRVAEK